MKVKCIANKGIALSQQALGAGQSRSSIFPLVINKEYNVYGIWIYNGSIQYLLIGEENLPSWYITELFEVVDNILPFEFYFDYKNQSKIETKWGYDVMIDAICGYEEMIKDESHLADLIEREDKAIKTFLKRKNEIDEMMDNERK